MEKNYKSINLIIYTFFRPHYEHYFISCSFFKSNKTPTTNIWFKKDIVLISWLNMPLGRRDSSNLCRDFDWGSHTPHKSVTSGFYVICIARRDAIGRRRWSRRIVRWHFHNNVFIRRKTIEQIPTKFMNPWFKSTNIHQVFYNIQTNSNPKIRKKLPNWWSTSRAIMLKCINLFIQYVSLFVSWLYLSVVIVWSGFWELLSNCLINCLKETENMILICGNRFSRLHILHVFNLIVM